MQESINKIFEILEDNKSQKFYKMCIDQLSQVQSNNLQITEYILEKCTKLFYSKIWDQRLICASIIEKCLENYCQKLMTNQHKDSFVQNYFNFAIKDDTFQERIQTLETFFTLQDISQMQNLLTLKNIDFDQLIQKQIPLVGRDEKIYQAPKNIQNSDEENILQEFGLSTSKLFQIEFDLESLISLLSSQQKLQSQFNNENAEIQSPPTKKKKKLNQNQKDQPPNEEKNNIIKPKSSLQDLLQQKNKSIYITTPFYQIYQLCLKNQFSVNWELRHSSNLLFRSFVRSNSFQILNFQFRVENIENLVQKVEQQWNNHKCISEVRTDLLVRMIVGLTKEQFVDYLFERSYCVVGEQIVINIAQLIKQLDEQNSNENQIIPKNNKKQTKKKIDVSTSIYSQTVEIIDTLLNQNEWHLIQSGLMLIKEIITKCEEKSINLYQYFGKTMIKLQNLNSRFSQNEEIQVLLTEIIILFEKIPNFIEKEHDFIRQVLEICWDILQEIEDISYSQVQIISLINLYQAESIQISMLTVDKYAFYIQVIMPYFYCIHSNARLQSLNFINHLLQSITTNQKVKPFQELFQLYTHFCKLVMVFTDKQQIEKLSTIIKQLIAFLMKHNETKFLYQESLQQIKHLEQSPSDLIELFNLDLKYENNLVIAFYINNIIFCDIFLIIFEKNPIELIQIEKNTFLSLLLATKNPIFYSNDLQILLEIEEKTITRFDIKDCCEQLKGLCRPWKNLHSKCLISLVEQKEFEQVYNIVNEALINNQNDINLMNCGKIIIKHINILVKNIREYQTHIKSLASCVIIKKNPSPLPLNLILKPLTKSLPSPLPAEIAHQFMIHLCMLHQNTPLFTKILKTVFQSYLQKENKDSIFKKQKLTKSSHNVSDFIFKSIEIGVFDKIKLKDFQEFKDFKEFKPIQHNKKQKNNIFTDIKENTPLNQTEINLLSQKLRLIRVFQRAFALKKQENTVKLLLQNGLLINTHSDEVGKLIVKFIQDAIMDNKSSPFFLEIFRIVYEKLKLLDLWALRAIKNLFEQHTDELIELGQVCIIPIIKSLNHGILIIKERIQVRQVGYQTLSYMVNSIWAQKNMKGQLFGKDEYFSKKSKKGNQFILDFKNNKNFDYQFEIEPRNVQLRPYQVEGIKWLAFLVRYNMHGALCDDMGLGKTLQILSVVQNEIYKHHKKEIKQKSLIICPTTLCDHWASEIQKFTPYLTFSIYRQNKIENSSDVWIVSYNQFSKNYNYFENEKFLFMILDEGHCIKNSKTKLAKQLKTISSEHRFVLTGTPIQNNLMELWSIFDFLNPGYLGLEDQFKNSYFKQFQTNILSFDDSLLVFDDNQCKTFIKKKNSTAFIEQLCLLFQEDSKNKFCKTFHPKQFKITIVTFRIFRQIYKKKQSLYSIYNEEEIDLKQNKESALQKLTNMRKLCNHPKMVYPNPQIYPPKQFNFPEKELVDFNCSGKLVALEDLFIQLNLINPNPDLPMPKILIFSRFKQTFIYLKQYLSNYPQIKYLMLDGTVQPEKRHPIVQSFQTNQSIQLLLLTTQVGGVGLNLTAANTVIMFDHDYNPMLDLQAIDRAHRIGQKQILQVYRLITKDTIEENIMGIQQFKKNIVNSVITLDNSSMKNVKSSDLEGLLKNVAGQYGKFVILEEKNQNKEQVEGPYKKIVQNLEELWDEQDYYKEY